MEEQMPWSMPPFVAKKPTSVPIRLGVLEELKHRLDASFWQTGKKWKQIDFVTKAVSDAIKREKLPM